MADEREERRKAKREELKSIVAEAVKPLVQTVSHLSETVSRLSGSVACIEARQANGLITDPRERLAMPPRTRDGKTPADVQLAFPATLEQLLVSGSELLPLSRTRRRNPWNKKKSHEFLDFYGIPDDPVSEGEDESTPRARDRRAKIAQSPRPARENRPVSGNQRKPSQLCAHPNGPVGSIARCWDDGDGDGRDGSRRRRFPLTNQQQAGRVTGFDISATATAVDNNRMAEERKRLSDMLLRALALEQSSVVQYHTHAALAGSCGNHPEKICASFPDPKNRTMASAAAERRVAELQREICDKYRREALAEQAETAVVALGASAGTFPREERTKVDAATLPDAYRTNSDREDALLDFVEKFRRQLSRLYPQRSAMLVLSPRNEAGVAKFLPTFVRPVKLPFPELSDHKAHARFVADFVRFVPQSPPNVPPASLVSPATLCSWREGSSFDMALLLCSALLGYGYDAYCVCGTTTRAVATADLSAVDCPLLVAATQQQQSKPTSQQRQQDSPYDILRIEKPVLVSSFLQSAPERQQAREEAIAIRQRQKEAAMAAESQAAAEDAAQQPDSPSSSPKPKEPTFAHCWVLVKAPSKGISADVLFEPTTGEEIPVSSPSILSVETVWNHENVWVNMQGSLAAATSSGQQQSVPISFALRDLDKFDSVLLEDSGDFRRPRGSDSVRLPPAWVGKPEIDKGDFADRYPGCSKTIRFRRCILELFSEHYLGNGLVQRLTVFGDDDLLHMFEIRETFSKRNDKLTGRVRQFDAAGTVLVETDSFARGKPASLLSIATESQRVTFSFWPPDKSTRTDGLASLCLVHGRKITEQFVGRSDRLVYRSAVLGPKLADENEICDHVKIQAGTQTGAFRLAKVTLKFACSGSAECGKEFEKVKFRISTGKIEVVLHKVPGSIVPGKRDYNADGSCQLFSAAEPLTPKPEARELADEFRRLLALKRSAIDGLQADAKEIAGISLKREKEEANVALVLGIFDTRWHPTPGVSQHSTNFEVPKAAEPDVATIDYLAPYLLLLKKRKEDLTKDLAVLLKRAALESFRTRLAAREETIQNRLAQFHVLLTRHNDAWRTAHKEGDASVLNPVPPEEISEHTRLVKGVELSIHALEDRLARLRATGAQSLGQMDQKLSVELGLK